MGRQILTSTGTPAWTPKQLPNLTQWLRSDIGITLNGATVSNWADQSGTGNDATQATGAKQPTYTAASLNGYAGLTFTSPNVMTHNCAVGINNSICLVGKTTTNTAYRGFGNWGIAGTGLDDTGAYARLNTNVWGLYMGADVAALYSAYNAALGCIALIGAGANSIQLANNGSPLTTVGTGVAFQNLAGTIGATNTAGTSENLEGVLYEIIVSSSVWSTANLIKLQNYVKNRYQL